MAKMSPAGGPYANSILQCLSPPTLKRFVRHLQPIELPLKQVLNESGVQNQYVYFVEAGMVSVVAVMTDSRAIEVGTMGKEGIVGGELVLGLPALPFQRYVQIAGTGFRLGAAILRDELEKSRELRDSLLRVHAGFLIQCMQNTACNGLHTVEQRCCRWILTAQDHTGGDSVALTHEFLGIMLGVRRASVSDVLKPLQDRGIVRSTRGVLEILKRPAMLKKSCECYGVLSQAHEHLSA